MRYYTSPYIFFLLKNGQNIVWDTKNHSQFGLEPSYFDRLKLWSLENPGDSKASPIDDELLEAGLIFKNPLTLNWEWDDLSLLYHVGTQNLLDDEKGLPPLEWSKAFADTCTEILESPRPTTKKKGIFIPLPSPNLELFEEQDFLNTLMRRQTSRQFTKEPLSLEYLSTLMFTSFGYAHGAAWTEYDALGITAIGSRKTSASQGGTHGIEAYVVALNVEGIKPGVYYYDPDTHGLVTIHTDLSPGELSLILADQFWAEELSVGVFLSARFDKVWWKYKHSRSYKDTYCDAGHLSQTFQLCATALGLSTWITGYFRDDEATEFLKITELCEAPLFFVGAGFGPPSPLHPIMIQGVIG